MARGDQLGRQWRIIQILVTSGAGKSAAELAQEMESPPRTDNRDLEALQLAGFPIYTERVWTPTGSGSSLTWPGTRRREMYNKGAVMRKTFCCQNPFHPSELQISVDYPIDEGPDVGYQCSP